MLRWCGSARDGIKFKCVAENPRQFWDSNFAPYEFRQYNRRDGTRVKLDRCGKNVL